MTTNELRSNLAQAELQAVHVSLTAMAGHVTHWTPERIAADPEAAHAGLDLLSSSSANVLTWPWIWSGQRRRRNSILFPGPRHSLMNYAEKG